MEFVLQSGHRRHRASGAALLSTHTIPETSLTLRTSIPFTFLFVLVRLTSAVKDVTGTNTAIKVHWALPLYN